MEFRSNEEKLKVLLRLSLVALYILLAYNLLMLGVGYYLINSGSISPIAPSKMVRNVIFVVAITEMVVLQFLKRAMLAKVDKRRHSDPAAAPETLLRELQSITIVIAAMSSTISTYGLVLVILGEKFEMLLFFGALSLVAYQLFRLRPRDFSVTPES